MRQAHDNVGAADRWVRWLGEHVVRYAAILVLCAFGLSCDKATDSGRAATRPAATAHAKYLVHMLPATLPGADGVVCVECPEDEAEVILVAELTIPKLFTRRQYRFPVKRTFTHDVFGAMRLCDRHHWLECADGIDEDGRLAWGYVGGVNVVDGQRSILTVELSFSWTAPDGTRGTLDETVPLTLGADGERWELAKGIILTARYLDVKPNGEHAETRPAEGTTGRASREGSGSRLDDSGHRDPQR